MQQPPWYKQFWPWFLILLPATAVTASIYTFFLASSTQLSLVSEDYYKQGKGINQDLSRVRAAQNLGLVFAMDVNEKEITIAQHGGTKMDTAIELEFHHATLAERDFSQMLTLDGNGIYRYQLEQPLDGIWLVQIDSFDQSWRLQKRVQLPQTQTYWFN